VHWQVYYIAFLLLFITTMKN